MGLLFDPKEVGQKRDRFGPSGAALFWCLIGRRPWGYGGEPHRNLFAHWLRDQ